MNIIFYNIHYVTHYKIISLSVVIYLIIAGKYFTFFQREFLSTMETHLLFYSNWILLLVQYLFLLPKLDKLGWLISVELILASS